MGFDLDFAPGPGDREPGALRADVDALRVADPEETVPFVMETIRILRRELPPSAPLIGFAGAPFTTFCYAVEGAARRRSGGQGVPVRGAGAARGCWRRSPTPPPAT
jgi:uroporphyrinogen-III decarboxylase